MGLSITVLGCSGSYSAPGLACTGYLLESETTRVWLERGTRHAGEPAAPRPTSPRSTPSSSPTSTRTTGSTWRWPTSPAATSWTGRRCPSTAPPGPGRWPKPSPEPHDLAPTIDWRVISDGDSATIGDQQWRFSRTDHPVETLAPRVDSGGRSFAFSADTGEAWSFASLGDGIDLGLCEATYLHQDLVEPSPHLSALQAGTMAADAGVERLLLTHLAPGSDAAAFGREATEAFGAPVELVDVDKRYEV